LLYSTKAEDINAIKQVQQSHQGMNVFDAIHILLAERQREAA